MDTVAKSETQPSTITVAPKQWKRKSTWFVREEEASKREQEEESEEAACSAAEQPQEQEREETEIMHECRNHPVPIPEQAARYVERLQLSSR